ncbi:cupin domain-containing protein [Enteractinococcus coprophilus]|uniref:Cupin domain n=1 Tax=Enteractinococcus coprophilus TaxID=1027633 RepID=A0A543AMY8_9MICC|nr:cupin domain-containing protein [Enteractinococcus coprophilus]TQL73942.1 hypothetical protein FB556_0391 [Enteractinococcus coprophilus]
MISTPRPQVTALEEGAIFDTKEMEASEGVQWPRHKASEESVLVVTEGQLIVEFPETKPQLIAGQSIVIPAEVWHEIIPDPTFKAIHIMPKGIRFTFAGGQATL